MARTTLIQRSRRVPASEKAAFHQIEGAGPRRVKREFLGLTAEDERAIVERVEMFIDRSLRAPR